MFIGYLRVSKADDVQVFDLQNNALLEAGVEPAQIYKDLASGRFDDRPGLSACLKALQPGDTLVVWNLNRLGKNLKHLINLIEEFRLKDVGFKIVMGQGMQIDTVTPHGQLVFEMFAALAEFERELTGERTKAGLAAARARGRLGGRPRKMDKAKLIMAMAAMADFKSVASEVAKRLGITTTTLYMYVNRDGTVKEAGANLLA